MIVMDLALRKIPVSVAQLLFYDSRAVRDPLERGGVSKCFQGFCSLTLPQITEITLTRVPAWS